MLRQRQTRLARSTQQKGLPLQPLLRWIPQPDTIPTETVRQRNIMWYNPPYRKNVKTNVGKCFLSLIDQHFPKSNPLHKIFNRNTLKLSYSCMNNVKTIISNHNKAEISKSTHNDEENKNCNCRKPNTCPMDGNCNAQNIVYQAEVTTPTTRETYIWLCDTTFKLRYRNHICSFRNERYRNATELSKHVWNLKNQNIKFDIKWRKVKRARSYSNVTKKCNLCLWEKYFIICKPEMATLNNRNELTSCCRHSPAHRFMLNTNMDLWAVFSWLPFSFDLSTSWSQGIVYPFGSHSEAAFFVGDTVSSFHKWT